MRDFVRRAYVQSVNPLPDRLLQDLITETYLSSPRWRMQISPEQGAWLSFFVRMINAQKAIEVGTFTGYSAVCIARALQKPGSLICCEANSEWAATAATFFHRAGLDSLIELKVGDAVETIETISPTAQFDFAFIDANKADYHTYYLALIHRLRRGGILAFDNTLLGGAVIDAEADSDDVRAIRDFNQLIAQDKRVSAILLPIADGMTLVRKL